jgi:hypothetical protein
MHPAGPGLGSTRLRKARRHYIKRDRRRPISHQNTMSNDSITAAVATISRTEWYFCQSISAA